MRDASREPQKTADYRHRTAKFRVEFALWLLLLVLAGMPAYAHNVRKPVQRGQ